MNQEEELGALDTRTEVQREPPLQPRDRLEQALVPHGGVLGIIALLLLTLAFPLVVSCVQQSQVVHQQEAVGYYHVTGNAIIDPAGNRFIVKGVNDIFGPFLPLDGGNYSAPQYRYAQRDFAVLKGMGANFVRVWVSQLLLDPAHAEMKTQLDNVMKWAEQQGFVVEVTNAGQPDAIQGPTSSGMQSSILLVQYLARAYKRDPHIWIGTANEPECSGGSYCGDWGIWHADQSELIQTIRSQGFQNPVVVDTPQWSTSLRSTAHTSIGIDAPQYALNDNNLVYGVHIYDFGKHNFWEPNDAESNDNLWGNYSAHHAVIVEELGPDSGGLYIGWTEGFLDYVANWVNAKSGSGAVAFLWFWSSGDSMTGTDIGSYEAGPTLNQWGRDYKTRYLDRVPGTKPA